MRWERQREQESYSLPVHLTPAIDASLHSSNVELSLGHCVNVSCIPLQPTLSITKGAIVLCLTN